MCIRRVCIATDSNAFRHAAHSQTSAVTHCYRLAMSYMMIQCTDDYQYHHGSCDLADLKKLFECYFSSNRTFSRWRERNVNNLLHSGIDQIPLVVACSHRVMALKDTHTNSQTLSRFFLSTSRAWADKPSKYHHAHKCLHSLITKTIRWRTGRYIANSQLEM